MFHVTYDFATEAEMKAFVAGTNGNATVAAGEKRGPGRPPGSGNKPAAAAGTAKHTRAEVNASLQEVKDKLGVPAAKEMIKSLGFDKMNDITEDKFDLAYDTAKAALAAPAAGDSDGGDI